jgi:hypothetical protein
MLVIDVIYVNHVNDLAPSHGTTAAVLRYGSMVGVGVHFIGCARAGSRAARTHARRDGEIRPELDKKRIYERSTSKSAIPKRRERK